MIVVDASVALGWFLDPLPYGEAESSLRYVTTNTVYVPANFFSEVAQGLLRAERRGLSTEAESAEAVDELRKLDVIVEHPSVGTILALARTHALTAYDASYLATALTHDVPLATLDRSLARAAASVNLLWPSPKKKPDK